MSELSKVSPSYVSENKKKVLEKLAQRLFEDGMSEVEKQQLKESVIRAYGLDEEQPLFQKRLAARNQLPYKEDFEDNAYETIGDLSILTGEHDAASRFIVDDFNRMHTERKRLGLRVAQLVNLAGDLLLLANEESLNTRYFKESFQDVSALDSSFALSSVPKAQISTEEGILTLGRSKTVNLSEAASVVQISGNGEPGMSQLVRKIVLTDRDGKETEAYRFINELDTENHKDANALLDNRADTLFEYQRVNLPEGFKSNRRHYDFGWASSVQKGDQLLLKIVLEVAEPGPINWISIDPYYQENGPGDLVVYSIRTSEDGFDYAPLFEGKQILNQTVNHTPQTYALTQLFDGSNDWADANYTGKGVWTFPERTVRFVEFVFQQNESYDELLGQEVYYIKGEDGAPDIQVPAPAELINQKPGEYIRTVDGQRVTYIKQVDAGAGWRYAIGLRDIRLMQYQFEEKSVFVSKRYESDEAFSRLVLYANEKIPESYLDIVTRNNDWIIYEVSFDDLNWVRISPMHQEPLNDDFPPKILEINQQAVDATAAFQIHKTHITTNVPANGVRLRITLTRPKGESFENTTPIVEDVALKVEKEGGF